MSEPIAIIRKNATEEIRVSWSEFKGKRFLDVRTFVAVDGQADMVPTKKGVALRPEAVPALVEALQTAVGGDPLPQHPPPAPPAAQDTPADGPTAPGDGIRACLTGVLDKGAEVRTQDGRPWLSFAVLADRGEALSPVRVCYFGPDATALAPGLVEGAWSVSRGGWRGRTRERRLSYWQSGCYRNEHPRNERATRVDPRQHG